MNTIITQSIVLSRLQYGEADRILKLLTRDQGKITVMARGVRKVKSKLAGSIELFGVSEIGYVQGKGDMGTLVTARLSKHFPGIMSDIDKTMMGYEILKTINKITEAGCDSSYFDFAVSSLEGLAGLSGASDLVGFRVWFGMQLLSLMGHAPNIDTAQDGSPLREGAAYQFHFDDMAFYETPRGSYNDLHIKLLRIAQQRKLSTFLRIKQLETHVAPLEPLVRTMLAKYGGTTV